MIEISGEAAGEMIELFGEASGEMIELFGEAAGEMMELSGDAPLVSVKEEKAVAGAGAAATLGVVVAAAGFPAKRPGV